MNLFLRSLVMLLLCFGPLSVQAQEVDDTSPATITGTIAQQNPTEKNFKVGDPIRFSLVINHPLETEIILPDAYGSERWSLIESKPQTTPFEQGLQTTLELTFAVFRPGSTTLPAFELTLLGTDGSTGSVTTEPVDAKILDGLVGVEDATFKPPRPPVEIWVDDYTLAWIGGILGSSMVFGLIGFFFWNRREVIVIEPPPRPPHEIALEKLSELAGGDLLERGETMLYYVKLSEAIREYIGAVHDFPGTELTTTEIMDELNEKRFPPGLSADDVGAFLRETDLVKFAGGFAPQSDSERVLRRAFTIVELTRMPTVQAPSEDEIDEEDLKRALDTSPWAPGEEE